MKQEHLLIGRITGPRVYSVPEFGTRDSFTLECSGTALRRLLHCRRRRARLPKPLSRRRHGRRGWYLRTASVDSFSQDAMDRPPSRPRIAYLGIGHCRMSAEQIR
jgi:hypothetical protein